MRDCVQREETVNYACVVRGAKNIEKDKNRSSALWLEISEAIHTATIVLEDLSCCDQADILQETQDAEIRCRSIVSDLRGFLEQKKNEWGERSFKRAWNMSDTDLLEEELELLLERAEMIPDVLAEIEDAVKKVKLMAK